MISFKAYNSLYPPLVFQSVSLHKLAYILPTSGSGLIQVAQYGEAIHHWQTVVNGKTSPRWLVWERARSVTVALSAAAWR